MKVSIVTPSFNQSEFIIDTIQSVKNQTYRNFEHIVVDAESDDGTREILEDYRECFSKVIIEPDDGQTDAINKGFKYATGDIYAYLNSDDYYFNNTLELVTNYFNEHPEVDVIYGDCVFTDAHGQFVRYFSEITDFDIDRLVNYSNNIMQPATFWRRNVFEKYGPFNKKYHFGFDWAFWCELATRGCCIHRVPHMLAANRVYETTKTSSGGKERIGELKIINSHYKTTLITHAYYRFYLAEIVDRGPKSVLDILRFPFLVMLSYGNIIHHVKRYKNKILYGFLPRTRLLQRRAALKLPRLNYKSIKINLASIDINDQKVVISRCGDVIGEYTFSDGRLEICVDLLERDVDIQFDFAAEYPLYKNIFKRLFYFYKPDAVSAVLLTAEMV